MSKPSRPKKKKPKQSKPLSTDIGIATQMALILVAGIFGGVRMDAYFNFNFPYFSVLLSIASFFIAIYWVIKKYS